MTMHEDLKVFKNRIIKYGLAISLLVELVSLPIHGWDPKFLYGLALGTSIAVVNLNFLEFTVKISVERSLKSIFFVLGYTIRMLIYGAGFYLSYKFSTAAGVAAVLGYLTLKVAIYYVYGFKPKFSKNGSASSESTANVKKYNDLSRDQWAAEARQKRRKKKNSWYNKIFLWQDDLTEDPVLSGIKTERVRDGVCKIYRSRPLQPDKTRINIIQSKEE